MQKLRIGIDYTSAVRQQAGIGRYTRELVTALLRLDRFHNYTVFAATGGLDRDRWRGEINRLHGIGDRQLTVRHLPLSDDWLARIWHRLRLPLPVELATGRLDLLYSPDFTLPPTWPGTRTLLTIHDLSFVRHPDAFVPALRRYLERVVPRSVERADVVLADSAHTRADLVSLFGISPDRVEVIFPGVDARFQPTPSSAAPPVGGAEHPGSEGTERLRKRYGIGERPYVLSVGTLQPRKNYVRLIHAFAKSKASQRRNMQLLIAGGRGWLFQDIVEEAEKYDGVRLLDFVDDEDLPAFYRGATLFAFPSLYEGFGLPVLEAMACGVPVVCSGTSSLPEVAGEAALLVDPFDVNELSKALDRVMEDDEQRQRMIERGLTRAARFTWERSARQLFDVMTSWEDL
jgi:glycosyltransferase involved in cell wall biosynthesis